MTHTTVLQSEIQTDAAAALVPLTVPTTWVGSAATACQGGLDSVRLALAGIDLLIADAKTTSQALDDIAVGYGTSPS